jgi:hypothetical protein
MGGVLLKNALIIVMMVLLLLPAGLAQQNGNGNADETDGECPEIVTYAVNEEGRCKEFSSTCKVPAGWSVTETCETGDYNNSDETDEDGTEDTNRLKIKERIKERAEESITENREKIKELRENVVQKIQEKTLVLAFGESAEIANGLSLRLEFAEMAAESECVPADSNEFCPGAQATAVVTISSPDSNFSEEVLLEGSKRNVIAGLSLKLVSVGAESARIQAIPIRKVLPEYIGNENLRIMPNLEDIAKRIDEKIDANILEELDKINRGQIQKIIINPFRKEIKAEIETAKGRLLKEIPELIMQKIAIKIGSINGIKDVNLLRTDGTLVVKTPSGEVDVNAEVEVDGNNLYINTAKAKKRLAVLPEDASEIAKVRANMHRVKLLEMETGGEEPVYRVHGMQRGKLLGIFPTEMDVSADVDIENGEVKRQGKPFWSFLVIPE